ncbi:unnamed protein product [Polarella glacialis]|uniref:Uncharacterized protein n=1 Tax=Polarella glacialis TaxID=89957 RepID=A0A813HBF3_POLGL|nr:unnamed protein product [Polarella glacialis]
MAAQVPTRNPPASASSLQLAAGMRIRVIGLSSRPELNGREGTLLELDASVERWNVAMDDSSGLSLRPVNLERVMKHLPVPQNGVSSSNAAAQVPTRNAPASASSSQLAAGMRIRVIGLSSRPELNGREGTLLELDASVERWNVAMDDSSGLCLRPANLDPLMSHLPVAQSGTPSGSMAAQVPIRNPPASASSSQLAAGMRIRVIGLSSRPELNGREGTLELESSVGRWNVAMDDGSGLSLRPVNLEQVMELLLVAQSRASSSSAAAQVPIRNPPASASSSQLAAGMRIRVIGLSSRPELNGRKGTLELETSVGRWNVAMDDSSGLSLRPVNLEQVMEHLPVPQSGASSSSTAAQVPTRNPPASASSLQLAAGMRIRVIGLSSRPELNGREGTLLELDESIDRWNVAMDDGSGLSLRPVNLEQASDQCYPCSPFNSAGIESERGSLTVSQVDSVRRSGIGKATDISSDLGACLYTNGVDDGLLQKNATSIKCDPVVLCDAPVIATSGLQVPSSTGMCKSDSPGQTVPHLRERFQRFLQTGERVCIPSGHSFHQVDHIKTRASASASFPVQASVACQPAWYPGAEVEIVGITSKPSLNGERGVLIRLDKASDRWEVALRDGSFKMLKSASLIFCSAEVDAIVWEKSD